MKNSKIETRTAVFWLDDTGILRIASKGLPLETLTDAQENVDVICKLGMNGKYPIPADIQRARFTDAKWRRFYSREEYKEFVSTVALLVESPLSRVIGNLFIGLNKLPMPARIFTSETVALEWLKGFLKKE